jgi:hypothetical protein
MDQNSSNGSDADKRNWRERLGIGAKEMPKLSDEFREGTQTVTAEAPRQAPSSGQPVTRPAPMAPRAPKAAAAPESGKTAPPPAAPRATPRVPDNAAQEALAEKLRAQRVAAEKLAEQRVQAARERAEGKTPPAETPAPQAPRPAPAAPRAAAPAAPKPRAAVPPPPPGARPKFSFAEDSPPPRTGAPEAPAPRPGLSAGAGAPLNPPRPALGGERGQPPFLRPSAAGASTRPQTPYRPIDPSATYGAPPRLQPTPGRPGFGADPAAPAYPAPRAAQRRPPALEAYPRQGEQRDYPEGDFDDGRQVPRLGRPGRGRSPEDVDEVFEDDGASRPRASAKDYQSAFGETEDAFAEDQRRSSGPWLLLLALLAAALITGAGVWYYNSNMKDVAAPGSSSGDVPVVNAPADPAKVAPEAPAAATEEPAERRKQIYDRIVGEQEVTGGQIESTEEIPVPPAAAQPAAQTPEATGANPIPAPDADAQGTGSEGLPTVDEPPPLPLPPAGQEGNLGQSSTERIAATAATPEQRATAPPPTPEAAFTSSTSSAALLPPPEPAAEGAAVVSETAAQAQKVVAAPAEPQVAEPAPADTQAAEPAPPPPPKKKPAAKKKPPEENLGSEPVVLVPPSEPASSGTGTASSAPLEVAQEAAPAPAPGAKPRSIMDLFRGTRSEEAPVAQPETKMAAVELAEPPAPAKKAAQAPPATGSGFMVQLSSFRSAADARKEYGRLSSLYPSVVGGLPEQIRETSVGGSTRYQLGLGPLPSRSAATKVCSALITAGESDCIVRGR